MGLDIRIKGLGREDTYHAGYVKFADYRMKVAKAVNETIGEIYQKPYLHYGYEFTEEDEKQWDEFLPDENSAMNKFLCHSDCDGKFTPKECKEIYNALKDLNVEKTYYNDKYTMHELWREMFKYCYEHRVNMWFE